MEEVRTFIYSNFLLIKSNIKDIMILWGMNLSTNLTN